VLRGNDLKLMIFSTFRRRIATYISAPSVEALTIFILAPLTAMLFISNYRWVNHAIGRATAFSSGVIGSGASNSEYTAPHAQR
jgi:hypothetical protein